MKHFEVMRKWRKKLGIEFFDKCLISLDRVTYLKLICFLSSPAIVTKMVPLVVNVILSLVTVTANQESEPRPAQYAMMVSNCCLIKDVSPVVVPLQGAITLCVIKPMGSVRVR